MTATPFPAQHPASERRSDPSMEEILASIRRIIADDDPPPLRTAAPPVMPPVREPEPTRQASVTSIAPPTTRAPGSSFVFSRPLSAPTPSPEPVAPVALEIPVEHVPSPLEASPVEADLRPASYADGEMADGDDQDSEPQGEVAAAAPASVDTPEVRPQAPADTGALVSASTTDSIASAFQALTASVALTNAEVIDRHVRDLLRPMLRSWLDDNLPTIVEKLVRTEIERVARGGR